ncbi:MAG: diheme cytochrome c, partial [Hydrogenophaga sp.]|nr:diheme cytochrome c [Hydrogenophaga sp.]
MKSILATLALSAIGLTGAHADSGPMMPRNVPQAYTQECAACHTAYPPGMLPARSWQRVMSGLDQHYGTDASLDAATVTQLGQWLQTHAGTYKRVNEELPQDRITRSAWFERKHRHLEPAVRKHTSDKSAANCAACHTGANRGEFDDDNLRFPPGLDARLRR